MRQIIGLYFILGLAGCSWFQGEPESVEQVAANDYKALFEKCNGNSCCEASARAVEQNKGFILKDRAGSCPERFRRNMMRCLQTYVWCEPDANH